MRVLVLFAIIGAALAAPRLPASRIVGGSDVSITEYPYMSSMQWYFMDMWLLFCGGSLVTVNAVLSAAHCYTGTYPVEWQVRLGSSYPTSGGVVHQVSRIVNHEEYDYMTALADLAIIRLATNAVLSASIAPVSIAGPNYVVPAGTPVYSVGWGLLSEGGDLPEVLQHVQIDVIDQNICAERYSFLQTQPGYELFWRDITEAMICAGILDIGGKSACSGDSGGPLSHKAGPNDVVVGVTSWGRECADPFYPAVQIRVSHYTDWIVSNASS